MRYEAVNAMLLNEFLKEHRKVEEEAEINRQQQASIARLETIVKEQTLQIQKVTAQLAAKNAGQRLAAINDAAPRCGGRHPSDLHPAHDF